MALGINKVGSRVVAACLCLLCSSAYAQYRRVENDKAIFTDRPCSGVPAAEQPRQGNSPKILAEATNSAYSFPSGTCRGQLQYQATTKGDTVPATMAVVPMT